MSAGAGGRPRSGWASSDDYTFISLAVIAIGLAFGGWMLWTYHHAEVVTVVATLQLWKMGLIARFTDSYAGIAALVAGAHYETVTFQELLALCDRVGQFFRIPAALLMGVLGVVCFALAPPSRYRRRLDLDGLAREQARFFRAASAALGRGLRLVPLRKGAPRPADPTLHAHEWAERFAVGEGGAFDAARAKLALVQQLAPVWRGARSARPAARIMFAAFALHLAGRREEVLGLLGDFAEGLTEENGHGPAGPEKPLTIPPAALRTADDFLRDPQLRVPAELVVRRHAYEATALMGLLNAARLASGVLAPAQFNGLKLVDRSLWYALHSLGFPGHSPGQNTHPNPRVEAIGARAHWDAERRARCALFAPEVDAALDAVRAALLQHRLEQEEQP